MGINQASTSQNPIMSGKLENWTLHGNAISEQIDRLDKNIEKEDSDDDTERTGLGCNILNRDVMYCVKMKVRIGSQYEYWKVLMDTGSRLNIVNNTVVSTHLRRPTTCPRVTTASGDITTVSEVEVDVFLTK